MDTEKLLWFFVLISASTFIFWRIYGVGRSYRLMSLFSFIIFSVTSGTGLTFLSDRLTLVGASYNGRSRISNGWQVSKAAFVAKFVQNWLFHGILSTFLL